jgi:hypothetical protein
MRIKLARTKKSEPPQRSDSRHDYCADCEVRQYESRWLPHFSFANLVGITLFILYIGGAMRSLLLQMTYHRYPWVHAVVVQPDTVLVRPLLPPIIGFDGEPNRVDRYIYVQPMGDLSSRLLAVASVLTLAKDLGAQPVVVWKNDGDDQVDAWEYMWEAPRLPLGRFPGNSPSADLAACTVHRVVSSRDWTKIHGAWEPIAGMMGNSRRVLCLQAQGMFVRSPKELSWFFRTLYPAETPRSLIKSMMRFRNWKETNVEMDVDVGMETDIGTRSKDAYITSQYKSSINRVAGLTPPELDLSFLVVAENIDGEAVARQHLTEALLAVQEDLINHKGPRASPLRQEVLSVNTMHGNISTQFQTNSMPALVSGSRRRITLMEQHVFSLSALSSLAEKAAAKTVASLYLLSQCSLLIAPPNSSTSQAAQLMGNVTFVPLAETN